VIVVTDELVGWGELAKRSRHLAAIPLMFVLAACARNEAATEADSPLRLTASIQDIMSSEVDPAADFIWESVSTEVTAAGTQDNQPHTDQEWLALRHQAITLSEAANLLVMKGRVVAVAGRKLEDAHVPGISSAAEIEAAIAADRKTFIAHTQQLQDASLQALAAIEAKDPQALSVAGGAIDAACESCHLQYWYPNSPRPPPAQADSP
jgi:hypothetical protein